MKGDGEFKHFYKTNFWSFQEMQRKKQEREVAKATSQKMLILIPKKSKRSFKNSKFLNSILNIIIVVIIGSELSSCPWSSYFDGVFFDSLEAEPGEGVWAAGPDNFSVFSFEEEGRQTLRWYGQCSFWQFAEQ